jgi:hypothetical protein
MKVDRMPPIKPKSKKSSAKAAAKSPSKSTASKTAPKKKAQAKSVPAKLASKAASPKPTSATRVPLESAAPTIPTGMVIQNQNLRDSGENRQEGRYVYGVISTREPVQFGKIGIGGLGELVYSVHHGDIAAVVSKTPVFIFDPNRDNALAHEHVIESVMKQFTVIPMSFGTVFRTDDDIKEVLKSIYPSLKDVLKQMEGKVEFGLKVTWDRDQIIEELKREDEEIHRFHQEITRKHLQSTYLARMQLGRMIDKSLADRAAQYVREIYEGLRTACVASRDNKPIGDKMILNAAFLIQRDREEEFDAAVNRIAKRFGSHLNFKYTGPWPPYNFVNIRLKLERGTTG